MSCHTSLRLILLALAAATLVGCHSMISNKVHSDLAKEYEGGPPQFNDPIKQNYRARFLADEKRYRATPDQVLPSPALGQPCNIEPDAREVLLLGETIAEFERQFAKSGGTTQYKDMTLTVLEGDCSTGAIQGPARLAGSYTQVSSFPASNGVLEVTVQKVIEGTFSNSEYAGEIVTYHRQKTRNFMNTPDGLVEMKSGDANTQKLRNSAQLIFTYGARHGKSLTGPNVSFSFQESSYVQTTNVSDPTGPDSFRMTSYNGQTKTGWMHFKNNEFHGEQVVLGRTTPTGVKIPEQRICWVHGERTKTLDCNVN